MAEKKVTSYVCTVTEEQAEQLRLLLDGRGWKFSEQPYARWKAELEKTNVVAYNSGKLTVQGGGTEDFVTFLLEPEILHTFTFGYEEEPAEEAVDPHGGVDRKRQGRFLRAALHRRRLCRRGYRPEAFARSAAAIRS